MHGPRGIRAHQLKAGELVCEAMWLNPVPGARDWHTIGAIETTAPMKMVVHADVASIPHDEESNPLPGGLSGKWLRGVLEKNLEIELR